MRFTRSLVPGLLALLAFASLAHAQDDFDENARPHRSFAFVQGSTVTLNGSWEDGSPLQLYAHSHAGHYIVFWADGVLHRFDTPARIAEVERDYAPMAPLEARQKELSARQKPFAEQQKTLAAQQRAAVGDPAEQGRIGQEQGKVGRLQGELGRRQGEIGRQQGEIGRAVYRKVQGMLTACLADGSCPRVDAETAGR